MIRKPPAFVLRCDKEDHEGEVWSIWEGKERVGTLIGHEDEAQLKLWESSVWITDWRGDCPSEKLQNFLISTRGDEWIHRARVKEMGAP